MQKRFYKDRKGSNLHTCNPKKRQPLKEKNVQEPTLQEKQSKLSPAKCNFLQRGNTILSQELPTHDTPSPEKASSKFEESCLQNERPVESARDYHCGQAPSPADMTDAVENSKGNKAFKSSSSVLGSDYLTQWRNKHNKTTIQYQQQMTSEGSTLSRYIQRFRNSEPKSRQERDKQMKSGHNFWWLSETSSSTQTSTPTGADNLTGIVEAPNEIKRSRIRSNQGRGSLPVSPVECATDTETDVLQTKADQLLEKSESTVPTSEPAVSSEGVGISSSSSSYQDSDVIADRTLSRPTAESFNWHALTGSGYQAVRSTPEQGTKAPVSKSNFPTSKNASRPEDDILHQWRVRRRMEEARRQSDNRRCETEYLPVSTPTLEKSPQDDNTCLAAFRSRLKNQQLRSEVRPGILPANTPPEPTKSNTGTDPIPQAVATQTNGTVVPSTDQHLPTKKEICGEGIVTLIKPHSHKFEVNLVVASKHTVASKDTMASSNIHESAPRQTVPPHFLKARDILPCPKYDPSAEQPPSCGSCTPLPISRGHDADEDSLRQRLSLTVPEVDDRDHKVQSEHERDFSLPPERNGANEQIRSLSPLDAAVGQVIADHLFATPKDRATSPQSSIDSLPSMHSSMRSQISDSHLDHKSSTSPLSSDGEELADDEILQLLRSRRSQYKNQLEMLDRLLQLQTDDIY